MTPEFEILLAESLLADGCSPPGFLSLTRLLELLWKEVNFCISGDGPPERGEIVSAASTFGPTAPRLSKVPEKLLRSLLLGDVKEMFPEEINS